MQDRTEWISLWPQQVYINITLFIYLLHHTGHGKCAREYTKYGKNPIASVVPHPTPPTQIISYHLPSSSGTTATLYPILPYSTLRYSTLHPFILQLYHSIHSSFHLLQLRRKFCSSVQSEVRTTRMCTASTVKYSITYVLRSHNRH